MSKYSDRPTVGFAFSGSGNRTAFYVGFLEGISEAGVPIDYISAMSGASLVAAAFACGALPEFKARALGINKTELKKYVVNGTNGGGMYSLDPLEEQMRVFTKGLNFEQVSTKMAFVAVDIENGEQVLLCMGDIAKAARISCTLPGAFEPVKWGERTLIDGGLLSQIPLDVLRGANMDITVGVNMRGTKHIFTNGQINAKKVFNFFKKFLFLTQVYSWIDGLTGEDERDYSKQPGIFSVLGKSLDLAIEASKKDEAPPVADIMIVPGIKTAKRSEFNEKDSLLYYESGRKVAAEYAPKIQKLIKEKQKVKR